MLRDFRTAWSAINAHRWFSLAIVAILALGIGINTTVFTLVNAVLFKAMPFRDGERLVTVGGQRRTGGGDGISRLDFLDYQAQSTAFELLEAVSTLGSATLSETGIPAERYRLAMATSGFFRAFRVEPILGRALQPGDEEPGAAGVVVLGYDVWRVRYQSSPAVIGRAVRLNEKPATIVGVMPRGLKIPNREDLWSAYNPGPPDRDSRQSRPLMLVGLLKPSVTVGMASTDLDLIARRLETSYPDTNKDLGVRLQTFNQRYNGEEIKTLFLMMLGAVFFVLLITCANVANMLLGRAIARHREMSIRAALGASRWQIVRQLLVESLVLSFLGGLAGLGLATLGVSAFDAATADVGKPSWILFEIDYLVVAYFVVICGIAAVVFGLAPALRSARVDLNDALKDGGRGGSGRGSRLSGALVVAQFTLAVALLAGAGLLMRSFVAQSMINRWMPRESTMTARVGLPTERYADKAARARFFDDLEARLRRVPGATHATLVSIAPGLGADYRRIELEGRLVDKPADRISAPMVVVSPSFFATFDLSIPRGRGFDERDGIAGREGAVVTAKFASTHWPGEDPIGKRFRFNAEQTPGPWIPVVGVSRDLQQSGNRSADVTGEPVIFIPRQQEEFRSFTIALRTAGDASPLAALLRQEVQVMDVDLALADVGTFESRLARPRWAYVVFGSLFGVFALAALLMAGVGLYAVVSQNTARRTREIGIRIALGATPRRIVSTVMRRGLTQLLIGLVLGLGGAAALTGPMSVVLFGVGPRDPLVFVVVSFVLLAVGMLACWLPARRAARVAPVVALAHDAKA